MPILEVKEIVKHFGGVKALNGVSFDSEEGKITGLLGANGSGKSTLSKIVTGIYCADSGSIIYCGKKIAFHSPAESKRNGIAMVFQNLSLVSDLTVWQNISLGCEKKQGLFLDNETAKEKAKDILRNLSPDLDINRFVYQLSTSEMQIVEIAKALIDNPRLLILDEPTASLEKKQVELLFAYMKKLAAQKVSMVFTSHRMQEVMEICDRAFVFKNGCNVGFLDFEKDERSEERVVSMITGDSENGKNLTSIEEKSGTNENTPKEIFFEVQDLSFKNSLYHLNLGVAQGEILGIGGLSGQGQEELMLALAGNYKKIQSKKIRLGDKELSLKSPAIAVANGIFLVPGDRNKEGLFLAHSVFDNLVYPSFVFPRSPFLVRRGMLKHKNEGTIKDLSIVTESQDTIVSTLSGGNAQKIVLGKWMNFEVKLLLLSDPAKGVDIGAKEDMYRLIRRMAKEKKTCVILYASDAEELAKYCDRVLIMYEGRFVAELAGEDISESQIAATSMMGTKQ